MRTENLGLLILSACFAAASIACEKVDGMDGGVGDTGGNEQCPATLPQAEVTCTAAECSATSGTKAFGEATLDNAVGRQWTIPVWATSEVASANENATIDYMLTPSGALTARERGIAKTIEEVRLASRARSIAFLGAEEYARLTHPARIGRVRAEAAIRAMQYRGPVSFEGVRGTAIRGRTDELLPPGVHRQGAACSAAATNSCGETSLCVIPEGMTMGNCETALTVKFATSQVQFDNVAATVKKVGTLAAVVVDDADSASVSDADATEILNRFDNHIGPLDHQFFGEPRMNNLDRDGNGVVIIFLTNRVSTRGIDGLVGYFQSDDLLPTNMVMSSNAADILYMLPLGANVSIDALSGTLGHEYQHLINYYQKKILRQAGPEELWLDEGIASFAEDMLGYGGDAFDNIKFYLGTIDQVSLTGQGLTNMDDSNGRRGMAHLLVRYVFEQAGGAMFGSNPGTATDMGGIAQIKKLVQSADTGTLLFTTQNTGRSFQEWIGDLMTTVSVDGAGYPDVSCNPKYSLRAPETDTFTGGQRGIDLHGSYKDFKGQTQTLNGPMTAELGNDTGIIIPVNGGEIRTAAVPGGTVKVAITGVADYEVGFRPMPTAK